MTVHINTSDLQVLDTAPRVHDLRLAEALQFNKPRSIRVLIGRHADELGRHGEVLATVAKTSEKGGRPAEEYWLNEWQAILVCMFSRTPVAADVREQIVKVFVAWRREQEEVCIEVMQTSDAQGVVIDDPLCEEGVVSNDHPLTKGVANAPQAPTAVLQMQLAMVRETRLCDSPAAGRRKMVEFGFLPDAPAATAHLEHDRDAWACLAHLLGFRLEVDLFEDGHRHAMLTLRDLVLRAITGEQHIGVDLEYYGVVIVRFVDEAHVWIANQCDFLRDTVFKGTRWDGDGGWRDALKRLPGSFRDNKGVFRVGHSRQPSAGRYLPQALLDEA